MKYFVNVLLPLPFDQCFSYCAQDFIPSVGDVVKVEFGKRKLFGVVFEILSEKDSVNISSQGFAIKNLLFKNENICLRPETIGFIDKIASYNCALRGLVLKSFIGFLNSDKVSQKTIEKSFYCQDVDCEAFRIKDLTEEQQDIADDIWQNIENNKIEQPVSLIDGVTGSGRKS